MYQLPEKLLELEPYDPISGDYKIRLDANESWHNPMQDIPDIILDALKGAKLNRYPDSECTGLIDAFCSYYHADPACVTASNGLDEMLGILINAFIPKGGKLLTVSPDFYMYRFYAYMNDVENVIVPKDENMLVDVEKVIETANAQKVDAVLFSNPGNPTSLGTYFHEVIHLIESVSCLVIVDEAYMDFYNQSVLDFVKQYDNLIVLRTCSKAVGLAGARIGFAIANETIANAIRCAKAPYNVNALSQIVGETVLREQEYLAKCRQEVQDSLDFLYGEVLTYSWECPKIQKLYTSCTNFLYMKMEDAPGVFEALKKKGIVVRCLGDYLRVTAGTMTENRAFVKAFKEVLAD